MPPAVSFPLAEDAAKKLLDVTPPGTPFAVYLNGQRVFDASRPATHLFYASAMPEAVRLDASNPKWIQLCTAGSYVYGDTPVTITPADFDQMIANFRAQPAYKPDGRALFGKDASEAAKLVLGAPYGVIALNFDHPPQGGPRPGHGWFVELERRVDQLWGLCWFDAEAHAGMLSGAWKWTSIEWQGDVTNNKGAKIGCYLSGVALTNDPFITGMTPIQMSRPCRECGAAARAFAGSPPSPSDVSEPTVLTQEEQAMVDALGEEEIRRFAEYPWEQCIADQKKKGYSEERASKICGAIKAKNAANPRALARGGPVVWFGPATDVLCELKKLFRLPETADVGAVIGEIAKLRTWALGQAAAPLGVDVGELVECVCSLLNLPTLSDPQTIFTELDKLLGALADEQERETMPPASPIDPNAPAPGLGLMRLFASRFSALLRTPVAEDEQSLVRAFDELAKKIEPALKFFDATGGRFDEAMGHVAAFKAMFGTDDAKSIADKMAQLMAIADQMKSLLGEAAQEHAAEEKAEGDMAAQDVQQVMAAQRLDPRVHVGTYQAYLAQRMGQRAALTAPTDAEVTKNPGAVLAFVAEVRRRREERPRARQHFFDAHGYSDVQKLQEQIPVHLRDSLLPALFSAGGHFAGPPAAAPGQQQGGAPLQFGQHPHNQPFTPGGGSAAGGAWTMDRILALPPVPGLTNGGDVNKRLAAELNRVEFGGKAVPGSREHDLLWQRVNDVMTEAQRN